MVTELGKLLRKLRVDREERLLDMAEKIGHSISFLSAVETGRKSPPAGFEERIVSAYRLETKSAEALRVAADRCRKAFVIEPRSSKEHDVTALFARRLNVLTDAQVNDIRRILTGGPKRK